MALVRKEKVDILAVANGWIVNPRHYDAARDAYTLPSETWVFNDWNEAQDFIKKLTTDGIVT